MDRIQNYLQQPIHCVLYQNIQTTISRHQQRTSELLSSSSSSSSFICSYNKHKCHQHQTVWAGHYTLTEKLNNFDESTKAVYKPYKWVLVWVPSAANPFHRLTLFIQQFMWLHAQYGPNLSKPAPTTTASYSVFSCRTSPLDVPVVLRLSKDEHRSSRGARPRTRITSTPACMQLLTRCPGLRTRPANIARWRLTVLHKVV